MVHGHWKQAGVSCSLGSVWDQTQWEATISCRSWAKEESAWQRALGYVLGQVSLCSQSEVTYSQLPGQEEPHGPKGHGERNGGLCQLQEILSYKYHKGRTIRSFDNHSNDYHHFTTGLLCGFYGLLHWPSDTWLLYTNLAWGISSWGKVRRKKKKKTNLLSWRSRETVAHCFSAFDSDQLGRESWCWY